MDKGRKDPNWERKTLTTVVTEDRVPNSGLTKLVICETLEDSVKFWSGKFLQLLYVFSYLLIVIVYLLIFSGSSLIILQM